jgi:hypothetical protein
LVGKQHANGLVTVKIDEYMCITPCISGGEGASFLDVVINHNSLVMLIHFLLDVAEGFTPLHDCMISFWFSLLLSKNHIEIIT